MCGSRYLKRGQLPDSGPKRSRLERKAIPRREFDLDEVNLCIGRHRLPNGIPRRQVPSSREVNWFNREVVKCGPVGQIFISLVLFCEKRESSLRGEHTTRVITTNLAGLRAFDQ